MTHYKLQNILDHNIFNLNYSIYIVWIPGNLEIELEDTGTFHGQTVWMEENEGTQKLILE